MATPAAPPDDASGRLAPPPACDLTWASMGALLSRGYGAPLQASDLPRLRPADTAAAVVRRLRACVAAAGARGLLGGLLRVQAQQMVAAGLCKGAGDLLAFVSPLALAGVVRFASRRAAGQPDEAWGGLALGYWWALAAFLGPLAQNFLLQHHHQLVIRAGIRVRVALSAAVFDRALALAPPGRAGAGTLANLVATDAANVERVYLYIHYLWASPMQLVICLALLYGQLGPPTFVALGVMLALVPLQGRLARALGSLAKATMVHADARLKAVGDVVGAVRVVKLLAFEAPFGARIRAARERELAAKRSVAYAQALNTAVLGAAPLVTALLAFLCYGLTSPVPLSPAQAFVCLTLFGILRLPLMVIPMLMGALTSARVSLRRIADVLDASGERAEYRTPVDAAAPRAASAVPAVALHDATLSWAATEAPPSSQAKAAAAAGGGPPADEPSAAQPFALSRVTCAIPAGALTCIVGPVGAGKSTLLAALLGELTLTAGTVELAAAPVEDAPVVVPVDEAGGTSAKSPPAPSPPPVPLQLPAIAYCSQQPFILHASIRANILFGLPCDDARYAQALDACALRADLARMPAGDATVVGDAGIALSGGQKARVALARALYSHAPLLLVDDALSALDAHVGAHVLAHGLRGRLAAGRTVVLATHQLQCLPGCARVLAMRAGRVVQCGRYEDVLGAAACDDGSANLVAELVEAGASGGGGQSETPRAGGLDEAAPAPEAAAATAAAAPAGAAAAATTTPAGSAGSALAPPLKPTAAASAAASAAAATAAAAAAEDRDTGTVPRAVYGAYLRAFGPALNAAQWLTLLAAAAAVTGTDVWLAAWADGTGGLTTGTYVWGYACITVGAALLLWAHALVWAAGGTVAARSLHERMLAAVLRAPTGFFDTTPAGRIVNRFSGDVDAVDRALPTAFASYVRLAAQVAGTIALEAVLLPWTLAGFAAVAALFWAIQRWYASSSRELKRLDAISKSPVQALLGEAAGGRVTLGAFRAGPRFAAEFAARLDANTRAFLSLQLLNRWLGLRLDWLGSAVVGFVCAVAVGTVGGLSAGHVGLAVSAAVSVTGLLNWALRSQNDVEQHLACVQRLLAYGALAPEEPDEDEGAGEEVEMGEDEEGGVASEAAAPRKRRTQPPPGWPTAGALAVVGLSVRYRAGLPLVLRGVTFDARPGEKLGIVGRTGAGKSSLALALFRVLEAAEGGITLDGVDIARVRLHALRSRLAIIPQDAQLFVGASVRANVDPGGDASDGDVWGALERVALAGAVRALGGGGGGEGQATSSPSSSAAAAAGLDALVTAGSFSAGQRQLLCFARALLRRPKLLVLDEATASTDALTDGVLQRMLRSAEFASTTMLIIAHRLQTVADADRVLVLDGGELVEVGRPAVLLADPTSAWARLVGAAEAGGGGGGVGAA